MKMVAFQGADSQKALVALIMTEKDQLEHADQDLVEQLDRTAVQPSDDFPQAPSQWSVLTNLRGVLSVLIEKQMLPVDLAASTREPIESFLHAWDHVQKLLRELERGPGSSAISLKSSTVSSHIEDAPTSQAKLAGDCSSLLGPLLCRICNRQGGVMWAQLANVSIASN